VPYSRMSSSELEAFGLKHAVGNLRAEMNAPMVPALETSRQIDAEQRLTAAEHMIVQTLELQHKLACAINDLQCRMHSTEIHMGTFEKSLGMAVGCTSREQVGQGHDDQHGQPPVLGELATKADIDDVKQRISACTGRVEGTDLGFERLSQRVLALEDLAHYLQHHAVEKPATQIGKQQQQQQQQPATQIDQQQQQRQNSMEEAATQLSKPLEASDESATTVGNTTTAGSTCQVLSLQLPVQQQQPQQQQALSQAKLQCPASIQSVPGTVSVAQPLEERGEEEAVNHPPGALTQSIPHMLSAPPRLVSSEAVPAPQVQEKTMQDSMVKRLDLEGLHKKLAGRVSGIVSSFSTGALSRRTSGNLSSR